MTLFTTKIIKEAKKLKACRTPPRVSRLCFWKDLARNAGDTKFQHSNRMRTIVSGGMFFKIFKLIICLPDVPPFFGLRPN